MKGIKCTSNEVNAILAGNKSQIRLVIKHQPNPKCTLKSRRNRAGNIRWMEWHANTDGKSRFSGIGLGDWKCPLGEIGDLVFVKETFCEKVDQETFEFLGGYHYSASCDFDVFMIGDDGFSIENKDGSERLAWKPAQHMKQHQSRITLRIKDISVERLQDISEEDCLKEGIQYDGGWEEGCGEGYGEGGGFLDYSKPEDESFSLQAVSSFKTLWNATHKKPEEKFEANPFVWKIGFEVVK